MIYRPFPHIIGDIVSNVRDNYSEAGEEPYYEYGVAKEVVNTLSLKDSDPDYKYKKYPLIWYLINDSIKETVVYTRAANRKVINVEIIICTETDPNFVASERYTNTFIPTLRPLYESFMYWLKKSKYISSDDKYSHEYYENLFWGRNGLYGHEGNIFNDMLDAIIISDLDLLVIEKC